MLTKAESCRRRSQFIKQKLNAVGNRCRLLKKADCCRHQRFLTKAAWNEREINVADKSRMWATKAFDAEEYQAMLCCRNSCHIWNTYSCMYLQYDVRSKHVTDIAVKSYSAPCFAYLLLVAVSAARFSPLNHAHDPSTQTSCKCKLRFKQNYKLTPTTDHSLRE